MTDDRKRSSNDQRSDVKNPNNPEHKSNRDNRANQLNPNHLPSKGPDHSVRREQGDRTEQ